MSCQRPLSITAGWKKTGPCHLGKDRTLHTPSLVVLTLQRIPHLCLLKCLDVVLKYTPMMNHPSSSPAGKENHHWRLRPLVTELLFLKKPQFVLRVRNGSPKGIAPGFPSGHTPGEQPSEITAADVGSMISVAEKSLNTHVSKSTWALFSQECLRPSVDKVLLPLPSLKRVMGLVS